MLLHEDILNDILSFEMCCMLDYGYIYVCYVIMLSIDAIDVHTFFNTGESLTQVTAKERGREEVGRLTYLYSIFVSV